MENKRTRNDIQGEITALKYLLTDTDYKCLKYAEGAMSEEEYAATRSDRAMWRERINELEAQLENMVEEDPEDTAE